jgi:hypothetical protein
MRYGTGGIELQSGLKYNASNDLGDPACSGVFFG